LRENKIIEKLLSCNSLALVINKVSSDKDSYREIEITTLSSADKVGRASINIKRFHWNATSELPEDWKVILEIKPLIVQ
jgi:hypothetical protein